MHMTFMQKATLAIAGLTAAIIGAFILVAPHAFYASYGIVLGADPNLLSELRAPAAGLLALGTLMLAGVFRAVWAPYGIVAAFAVFLAFPAGRVVSIVLDGVPSGSVLGALAIEVVIAVSLTIAFARDRAGSAVQT